MRLGYVCLLLASACLGQEFEVVSVKPNNTLSGSSHSHSDRGRLTTSNVSLKSLITMAYGMKPYQVAGPDWLSSEKFDIAAKFPEALPKDRMKYEAALQAMLRNMLEDRFKLAAHHDTKTLAVYGLLVAKNGIKFKQVPENGSSSNSNNNHYTGESVSMDKFASFLSSRMDLPVLDMTGLKGAYDLKLDWVPESQSPGDAAATPSGPILLDALQDQLGLRLERRKAPVEILIVDRVEKVPTEN